MAIAVLHGALKVGRLTSQRSILWTTHRMPRMPGGEGGEARGRLSCSRVISLCGGRRTRWSCHIRVPSRGGRRLRGGIESTLPCSQRTARLAGSIRREAAYQAPVFWRAQQLQPRWQSRPRFERAAFRAAGSNRGRLMPSRSDAGRAARACAKCDNRRQTTDA